MTTKRIKRMLLLVTAIAAVCACCRRDGRPGRADREQVRVLQHLWGGCKRDHRREYLHRSVQETHANRVPKAKRSGGFRYPARRIPRSRTIRRSPEYGDVYVADRGNNRVQVLKPDGEVRIDVWLGSKQDKGRRGRRRRSRDAGRKEHLHRRIQRSLPGRCRRNRVAGQLRAPKSFTIDPSTGNLYVREDKSGTNPRVDQYTAEGGFVWMIGKAVNETNNGNICTEKEIEKSAVKCKGALKVPGVSESRSV